MRFFSVDWSHSSLCHSGTWRGAHNWTRHYTYLSSGRSGRLDSKGALVGKICLGHCGQGSYRRQNHWIQQQMRCLWWINIILGWLKIYCCFTDMDCCFTDMEDLPRGASLGPLSKFLEWVCRFMLFICRSLWALHQSRHIFLPILDFYFENDCNR